MRTLPPIAFLVLTPSQIASLVIGVLAFVILLALSFVAMRWLQKNGFSGGAAGEHMKVVDRMMLSRDSAVLLLRIGTRLIAVGQGKEGLHFLCELSPSDFPEEAAVAQKTEKDSFLSRFFHNLKVNARLAPKGTPHRRPGDGAEKEPSFGDVFRQMSARQANGNPMPGGGSAPDSGYAAIKREHTQPERRPPSVRDGAAERSAYTPPPARSKISRGGVAERDGRLSDASAHGSYQEGIDRLMSLSEPDALDRRTRPAPLGFRTGRKPLSPSAPPQTAAAHIAAQNAEDSPLPPPAPKREEKIDELLDRIAERQSRYNKDKDTL